MTARATMPYDLRQSRLVQFFQTAFVGSPTLSLNAVLMMAGFVLCAGLSLVDARTFNGINLWLKPGKFFFSMSVHFITVAWALSWLRPETRKGKRVKILVALLVAAAWAELLYIAVQAAQAQASHFNTSSTLYAALYSAMALLAIVLVAVPAALGWLIWRESPCHVVPWSIALGFGVAAVASVVIGMTLGGHTSHWIGGDLTDATGLPFFKWSTTGGDLRVSHFIALHMMQAVPFAAAVSGKRSVVYSTIILMLVFTALTFAQALMGIPLLKV